jgi:hypothetical protein
MDIFMNMKKMTHHIRVRLTESQFNKLVESLIIQKRTKSQLFRDLIDDFSNEKRSINKETNKTKKGKKL